MHSKNALLVLTIFSLGAMSFAAQNAFADPPEFTVFVADDPDNADRVYSNGDTLTITFDQVTNATGGGVISQGEINANFTFASPAGIGTAYSGVWAADSTSLTITVTDVGAAVLVVGTTTVDGAGTTTISDAGGANADLISLNAGGPLELTGDFGSLSGGSKCDRDCTPPTMGPSVNGDLIVEDGFSYNGHSVNVSQWHTEYPLITVQTGKMNVLEAKIHDDWGEDNIRSVRIAFGVPEIGKFYQGETIIEYYPNEIIGSRINVIDKNNLLDRVSITTEKVDCNSGDNSPICTLLTMEHMFREAPLANVVGISLSDDVRNSAAFFFNDGIGVDGESLNPPQTATTSSNKKGISQIQLTQIDRGEDLWIDEQNHLWSKNSFGTWFKITPDERLVMKADPVSKNGIDRKHGLFTMYKAGQELIATQIWNSAEIQSEIADFSTIVFEQVSRMDNPEIQKTMLDEIKKAEQIYAQKYN